MIGDAAARPLRDGMARDGVTVEPFWAGLTRKFELGHAVRLVSSALALSSPELRKYTERSGVQYADHGMVMRAECPLCADGSRALP